MKKSRLSSLLLSCDSIEKKKLIKYIKENSTGNNEMLRILTFMFKGSNLLHSGYIDNESIRIKSKSKLNKQSFANAVQKLCNEIERFFLQIELNRDKALFESLNMKVLAKRGLAENFYRKKKKFGFAIELDLWNEYYSFCIHHFEYFYNINKNKYKSGAVVSNAFTHLKSFVANISHYYSLEMHNRSVIIGENWEQEIDEINHMMLVDTPLSEIFDQLIILKTEKKESAYLFLKQTLTASEEQISKEIKNAIYVHICSFLNHKIKNGQVNRIPELLEWYEFGFKEDIVNFTGQMSIRQYLTIINTACSLKAFDWINKFKNKWIQFIDSSYKNEILNLVECNILFAKQRFSEVVIELETIKLKDLDVNYRIRWLKLMSFYEIDPYDIDSLEKEIRNFRYFIKINDSRLEPSTILAITNSLNFIQKLITVKIKKADIELFKTDTPFIRKQWLIEKYKISNIKI